MTKGRAEEQLQRRDYETFPARQNLYRKLRKQGICIYKSVNKSARYRKRGPGS